MVRTQLWALLALAIAAMVGGTSLLAQPSAVEAQSHSATRSFPANWAAPGGEVEVTITASNLGGFGQVEETLPEGFTYVRSSIEAFQVKVTGQTVLFTLVGGDSLTYAVTAPATEGQFTFSGVVRNADRVERTIAGHTTLRIGAPPTPAPTSTPTSTPEPTPTPEPETTPTPEPTATPAPTAPPEPAPTPAPEPTAAPEPTSTPTPEATATPQPSMVVVVTNTPTPTPAVAPPTPAQSEPAEYGGETPSVLWLIPVILGVGFILAVFAYRRRRQ